MQSLLLHGMPLPVPNCPGRREGRGDNSSNRLGFRCSKRRARTIPVKAAEVPGPCALSTRRLICVEQLLCVKTYLQRGYESLQAKAYNGSHYDGGRPNRRRIHTRASNMGIAERQDARSSNYRQSIRVTTTEVTRILPRHIGDAERPRCDTNEEVAYVQLEHLRQIRAHQVATFVHAVCVALRAVTVESSFHFIMLPLRPCFSISL
jgi:hypothetical protein